MSWCQQYYLNKISSYLPGSTSRVPLPLTTKDPLAGTWLTTLLLFNPPRSTDTTQPSLARPWALCSRVECQTVNCPWKTLFSISYLEDSGQNSLLAGVKKKDHTSILMSATLSLKVILHCEIYSKSVASSSHYQYIMLNFTVFWYSRATPLQLQTSVFFFFFWVNLLLLLLQRPCVVN